MKTTNAWLALALAAVANCNSNYHAFKAPGPHDRRGPCPMLNSLANHGFIAHTGLNISIDDLVDGIDLALNLAPNSSLPVAQLAVTTSTTGNPSTLNLDDLDKHGVIEHDGSLSRNDIYFGDNHDFNERIFDTTAAHFTQATISLETAAKTRTDRIKAAKKVNPTFNFTATQDQFSQFETALYLGVFGNGTKGHARTDWVLTMFREERLPYEEGFKRPTAQLTNDEIVLLAQEIANISDIHW